METHDIEEGIAIHRIANAAGLARWREGLVATYVEVFSGFPYFEQFSAEEAAAIVDRLFAAPGHIVLVAVDDDRVVGFAAAIPLVHMPSVAHQLTGLVPLRHTFYLAELAVLPAYRGKRIGRNLVRARLSHIDRTQYTHVVLRISADHTPSGDMYKALGFADMGVYMDVRSRRVDGEVRVDRRLFLSRVLSQVDLGEE